MRNEDELMEDRDHDAVDNLFSIFDKKKLKKLDAKIDGLIESFVEKAYVDNVERQE